MYNASTAMNATINGGGTIAVAADTWVTLATGEDSITTITSVSQASASGSISAIRVDDKILVDTALGIVSTYRANPSAGFSIVSYVGIGANATVAHGLNAVPKMIIVKNREAAESWPIYHVDVGNGNRLYLNGDNGSSSGTNWNSTTPTSTVFSIGNNPDTNQSTKNIIAYCWSEVEGYSKFGSYTGNGTDGDGPFVWCGFKPRFIMLKRTDNSAHWGTYDTERDTYNEMSKSLSPSQTTTETAQSDDEIDVLSNGFKLRSNDGTINASSSATYLFAAFSETPFKYSNAR